jgi:nitrogen fixation NifU-like protein
VFSEKVLEHFRSPRNAGELADATHVAQVTNPVCGDVLRLAVRVEAGVIVAARFKAQGCVPAIAAASATSDIVVGKTLTELRNIAPAQIVQALDGLPEASFHAAQLCCAALAALV